ncbi:hypothetical protein [Roseomonas sp. BN140053]|uniref:hypothetical protein n=1 Tax=Roseomonas sp. BN140053 TaxID=3391898 RepID=UPI0039EB305E
MTALRPLGSAPLGARLRRDPTGRPVGVAGPEEGPLFFAVEIEALQPGTAAVAENRGMAARPMGALARRLASREVTTTLRASDVGYRTRAADAPGVVVYPPLLDSGFQVDRELGLAPAEAAQSFAWGTATLINAERRWDGVARGFNADGRRARVLAGRRTLDPVREIWLDPPYAEMREVFAGIAQPWSLTEEQLQVPLRDAGYWIERPLQMARYAGTGDYEGTADMAGQLKPKVRGGAPGAPVRQVTPRLIDPVRQIYQVSDGPITVAALYEAGDPTNITLSGDVSDLLTGQPPLGQYRTCNARGCFQLRSKPAGPITVDCTGAFPLGGMASTAAAIARFLLLEEMQLPAAFLDEASFLGLDAAFAFPAGWCWTEETDGAQAVALLLASVGARMAPTRTGRLRALPLARLPAGARPVATYTATEIISVVPRPLPAPLWPPPAAWQVGWGRNFTVQNTGLDPDVQNTTLAADLAQEWRQASASSTDVLLGWRRPSQPPLVQTALTRFDGAGALAASLRDLWCQRRPVEAYDVTLPAGMALRHELGEAVVIAYPLGDLDGGRLGQVVGDKMRAGEPTGQFTVLLEPRA